ncbi:uncharacterized protein PpBr36_06139 [Pyricularia pennisetigena]|uniref:uncharacterized protein n=1 Tax=Pyricularia pennisetigena TaxID=1578925 RepID=UPI0011548DCD|nr:uncharacterized protein PpBr36_06139 [Pyricularia pennisetigena]TLS23683.1 hypothetical protein PpBr36_06139 [Pyricularia pennisetigena]
MLATPVSPAMPLSGSGADMDVAYPPSPRSLLPLGTRAATASNLVASFGQPQDPEERWWWARCGPLFYTILKASGSYTAEQTADHMRVVRDVVVPSLGPRPSRAATKALITLDGSPMEPSWNFTRGRSVVRYAFEPLWDTGSRADEPFGGRQVPELVRQLAGVAAPDTDLGWFDQIWARWSVAGDEAARAKQGLVAHGKPASARVPQLFLAFDHHGAERRLKSYHFPMLKHLATGASTEQLMLDMIADLRPGGDELQAAAAKMKTFLDRTKYPAAVEMLSIDCVDPRAARVKIYARTRTNSLDTVRETMTLAGLQTDEHTMEGVARVERFWHLLLDERRGMDAEQSKELRVKATHHTGICFVFEIRRGSDHVSVKPQMPWCQTNGTDARGTENFAAVLRMFGWEDHADRFEKGVKAVAALPGQNYATESGGLSYLAYEYNQKGGDYISTYFSPRCDADHGLD